MVSVLHISASTRFFSSNFWTLEVPGSATERTGLQVWYRTPSLFLKLTLTRSPVWTALHAASYPEQFPTALLTSDTNNILCWYSDYHISLPEKDKAYKNISCQFSLGNLHVSWWISKSFLRCKIQCTVFSIYSRLLT